MKSSWDLRIERASELSQKHPVMSDLLTFYAHVARFQKSVYEKIGHEQRPQYDGPASFLRSASQPHPTGWFNVTEAGGRGDGENLA